jgi:hypothetical protein
MGNARTEIEDALTHTACEHADGVFSRLLEIANADPPMDASLKAAELIVKLSREETSEEKNLLPHKWF